MKKTLLFPWLALLGLAASLSTSVALAGGQAPSPQVMLEAARKAETVDGDPKAAISQYEQIVKRFPNDRAVVADALVRMAGAYKKLGDTQSKTIYERVVREYGDQASAAAAARVALGAAGAKAPFAGPATAAMRRVWSGAGANSYARVSPDGRFIAFVDPDSGDLALRDVEAGTSRRLTHDAGNWSQFAQSAAFSPDGHQIAYGWFGSNGRYEVRIVGVNGGAGAAPRTVVDRPDIEEIGVSDWTRDGKWLAVTYETHDNRGAVHLARLDVADGRIHDVRAKLDRFPTRALFSPDGRFVAYDVVRDNEVENRDIVVRSLAEEAEWFVAPGPGYDELVGWGPDGNVLAFASDRSGVNALWVAPLNDGRPSGEPRQVYGNVGDSALGLTTRGALFVGVVLGARDVHVVAVDTATGKRLGEPERPIDRRLGPGSGAVWSPDGTRLAFALRQRRRGQGRTLAVRDMRTGDVRQFPTGLRTFNFPKWSPDGRALAVQGVDRQGRECIVRVAVDSGEVTPLVVPADGVSAYWPSWSADGRRVYFLRTSAGKSAITVERDLASGQEREFPGVPNGIASPTGPFLLSSPGRGEGGGRPVGEAGDIGGRCRLRWKNPKADAS